MAPVDLKYFNFFIIIKKKILQKILKRFIDEYDVNFNFFILIKNQYKNYENKKVI